MPALSQRPSGERVWKKKSGFGSSGSTSSSRFSATLRPASPAAAAAPSESPSSRMDDEANASLAAPLQGPPSLLVAPVSLQPGSEAWFTSDGLAASGDSAPRLSLPAMFHTIVQGTAGRVSGGSPPQDRSILSLAADSRTRVGPPPLTSQQSLPVYAYRGGAGFSISSLPGSPPHATSLDQRYTASSEPTAAMYGIDTAASLNVIKRVLNPNPPPRTARATFAPRPRAISGEAAGHAPAGPPNNGPAVSADDAAGQAVTGARLGSLRSSFRLHSDILSTVAFDARHLHPNSNPRLPALSTPGGSSTTCSIAHLPSGTPPDTGVDAPLALSARYRTHSQVGRSRRNSVHGHYPTEGSDAHSHHPSLRGTDEVGLDASLRYMSMCDGTSSLAHSQWRATTGSWTSLATPSDLYPQHHTGADRVATPGPHLFPGVILSPRPGSGLSIGSSGPRSLVHLLPPELPDGGKRHANGSAARAAPAAPDWIAVARSAMGAVSPTADPAISPKPFVLPPSVFSRRSSTILDVLDVAGDADPEPPPSPPPAAEAEQGGPAGDGQGLLLRTAALTASEAARRGLIVNSECWAARAEWAIASLSLRRQRQYEDLLGFARALEEEATAGRSAPLRNLWAQVVEEKMFLFRRDDCAKTREHLEHTAVSTKMHAFEEGQRFVRQARAALLCAVSSVGAAEAAPHLSAGAHGAGKSGGTGTVSDSRNNVSHMESLSETSLRTLPFPPASDTVQNSPVVATVDPDDLPLPLTPTR